ncbi:MAG: cytidylate kinase-like family protein [Muribaculaceae bacterium]|nr:cytidylate kinase-like family protein [Muribaculaceae bacterium]
MKDFPERFVITIGRTFGSGGRELGRLIAERLGISFYDKMLLVKAAEKAGLRPEFLAHNDEKPPKFFGGLSPLSLGFYSGGGAGGWLGDQTNSGSDHIYQAQSDFMHELAATEPCVIVGRSADYILRDVDNVVNIFVHAPIEACVKRIRARSKEPLTDMQAKTLAEKTNKLRANFYNFYTDKRWGHASTYDLCLDSERLSMDELADLVIDYARRRFAKSAQNA